MYIPLRVLMSVDLQIHRLILLRWLRPRIRQLYLLVSWSENADNCLDEYLVVNIVRAAVQQLY